MAQPTITCRVAFASQPFVSIPTYTDISAYLRTDQPITIRRGRQAELDRIQTGTASLRLDNRDRRFDPTYSGSPYAPNIKPNRSVNIRATWASTTYDLFTGFADGWPPAWPLDNRDSIVQLDVSDAFKMFARQRLSITRGAEYTGWRVGALLDAIGWPAGQRNIEDGLSYVQAVALDRTPILQHLLDVAETENGLILMGAHGRVLFQNRHYRLLTATSTTSQGIFGDAAGELPYTAIEPVGYDDDQLKNDVTITAAGGTPQNAADLDSQAEYGALSFDRTLLIMDDNEAADAAQWILNAYRVPGLRFRSLELDGNANAALWPLILGLDIGARITVRKRPVGGGGMLEQECFIEAIEHRITSTTWRTRWQLSRADVMNYFVFDDDILGQFDYGAFAY